MRSFFDCTVLLTLLITVLILSIIILLNIKLFQIYSFYICIVKRRDLRLMIIIRCIRDIEVQVFLYHLKWMILVILSNLTDIQLVLL